MQRRDELAVRLSHLLAGAVERDLEPVELEGRIQPAAAKRVRELQDLVDVPLRVVVGEHRSRDVLRAAGGGQVA